MEEAMSQRIEAIIRQQTEMRTQSENAYELKLMAEVTK